MLKIVVLMLLLSFSASAGLVSKAVVAGGGTIAFHLAKKALISGSPKAVSFAAKRLQSHLSKNPGDAVLLAGLLTSLAIEHPNLTEKTIGLLEQVPSLNVAQANTIREQSAEYQKAKEILEAELASAKAPQCQLSNYEMFIQSDLSKVFSSPKNPVSIYDVGSFRDLQRNEVAGDGMQHDHVPSKAAVQRYLEGKLKSKYPKNSAEEKAIRNNATAVEVCDSTHCSGRTFRGLNNASLVELDASNLLSATIKDFSYHLMNSGFDHRVVQAFVKTYQRNSALCLYN